MYENGDLGPGSLSQTYPTFPKAGTTGAFENMGNRLCFISAEG